MDRQHAQESEVLQEVYWPNIQQPVYTLSTTVHMSFIFALHHGLFHKGGDLSVTHRSFVCQSGMNEARAEIAAVVLCFSHR